MGPAQATRSSFMETVWSNT